MESKDSLKVIVHDVVGVLDKIPAVFKKIVKAVYKFFRKVFWLENKPRDRRNPGRAPPKKSTYSRKKRGV